MLDLFIKDVNIGDKVKLYLTTGKEPTGTVLEIGSNHLLLKNEEGTTTRIFEILIGGWDIIDKDLNDNVDNKFLEHVATISDNDANENKDQELTPVDLVTKHETEKLGEFNEAKRNDDNILREKTKEIEINDVSEIEKQVERKIGITIVGRIPLENLDLNKNRFPTGRTYRLREVSKEVNLPVSEIVRIIRNNGIKIEENNPNFRIDQVAYDKVRKAQTHSAPKVNDPNKFEPKAGLKLNSLSDLSKLKEKIEIDLSEQLLPANAIIKRYFPQKERHYGFLTDNNGLDYYFKFSEVKEDLLLKKLNDFGLEGTQIICHLENNGRLLAKNLYLPQTVNSFQGKAEQSFERGDTDEAMTIINIILSNFPDYSKTLELKTKVELENRKELEGKYNRTSRYISNRNSYKKRSDLGKAQFFEAIEKDDQNSEKAIKELAYLLSGQGQIDEAINLVTKHSDKIKSTDPNSFIAYFYEAKKDYKNAIGYLKKIKLVSQAEEIKLSKRLALCYVGNGDYEIAEIEINKVLKNKPKDTVANKLKEAVLVAKAQGSEEDIDSIFKEAEISALTGGLSKYILHILERCEFAGVPATEIAQGNFNKKTLANLKAYIETIKDGRPRERAEAYLSQAKIEQILDSENTKAINGALAKYCASIAISWATERRQVDTLRYFLLETAILEAEYFILNRYIPLYLHSYSLSSFDSKSKIRQNWSELLNQVITDSTNKLFWYGVLELLLVNSKFSTQFLTSLFNEASYRDKSLSFLMPYINVVQSVTLDKETFLQYWKTGREKLKREKDGFNAKFSALLQSNTSESLVESFLEIKENAPEWLGQLNKQRLDSLRDIIETIIAFNKQQLYEDKERYFNIIVSQLSQLKDDIQDSPTEFSFSSLIPIINFTLNLMESGFKDVIETSKPKMSVQVYGEGSKDEKTDIVNAQFAVSNKKGSAPVSYFKLTIINDINIEFIEENNILEQNLKGGDEQILKLKLKVKNKIIEEGATTIKIEYSYTVRGNDKEFKQQDELPLRFYSSADFEKIENVFATTADSGPVQDTSMFFGRDEFISNIKESITNSKSKCVIIYGQKRSGKSSVLHHLRESLNHTPETFCISFSLGEIIEDLSPKTFYYTILSEIEDSLFALSEKYDHVPQYTAPEYNDLDEAPAILFNDQIKLLNREFKKYPDWTNKRLVLLIDEFTYIYTAIKKAHLSEQFMKTWKSFLEKGFFNSVLIGQDIMPKFKAAYPNEFGVTEDKRLSYLKKSDAVALIEKPIWDKSRDRSRFLGKATDLILDYTSSNPYYVQIFCARLVDYMNEHKVMSITEADVHDVADSFIKGEQALTVDKFDNLITAGDADLDAFNSNDVLSALKTIAIASKNLDSCPREAINLGEVDYEERILKDLKDREVLSIPEAGYFKINVRLFKEWLLVN